MIEDFLMEILILSSWIWVDDQIREILVINFVYTLLRMRLRRADKHVSNGDCFHFLTKLGLFQTHWSSSEVITKIEILKVAKTKKVPTWTPTWYGTTRQSHLKVHFLLV